MSHVLFHWQVVVTFPAMMVEPVSGSDQVKWAYLPQVYTIWAR